MPRRRKDHPILPGAHLAILEHIRGRLPPGYRILLIGNAALQARRVPAVMTRDVDASLHGPDGAQPSWPELVRIARAIDPDCEPASDHAAILLHIPTPTGPAEVDLVRGRRRPGHFLTRDFLELVARVAEPLGDGTLLPPPEAIAVMKAWAAHDQGRRQRGARRDEYVRDLDALRDAHVSQGRAFNQSLLASLVGRVRPGPSRTGVRTLLTGHGVLIR